VARGWDVYQDDDDDEPVTYFVDILPRLKRRFGGEVDVVEVIQEAGDTIFIPSTSTTSSYYYYYYYYHY